MCFMHFYIINERGNKMQNKKTTKLYVITGSWGLVSTLLLKLLEHLKGSRVGIIQNEFGKLGIDGVILKMMISIWLKSTVVYFLLLSETLLCQRTQ